MGSKKEMVRQIKQMNWTTLFKHIGSIVLVGSTIVYVTIYITNIKSDVRFAITSINDHIVYNNQVNETQAKINSDLKAKAEQQDKALSIIQTKLEVAVTILERIDNKVGKP